MLPGFNPALLLLLFVLSAGESSCWDACWRMCLNLPSVPLGRCSLACLGSLCFEDRELSNLPEAHKM